MPRSAFVSGVVALLASIGLTSVFVMNASPYVKINELSSGRHDGVHVVGNIVDGTLQYPSGSKEARFMLKDATGQMPVIYTGPPITNLADATQVVVIGDYDATVFHSDKMLVKCPSKYENQKGPKAPGA